MLLRQARRILQDFEPPMTIARRDGEYRVNYRGASDTTAYYTDDMKDAIQTAVKMEQAGIGEMIFGKHDSNGNA